MSAEVKCPLCDSSDTLPFGHVEDVYECLACGDLFEDDRFILREIKKTRHHKQKKDEDQPRQV